VRGKTVLKRRKGGTVLDCICITGLTCSLLEELHGEHMLLGILGLGARKP